MASIHRRKTPNVIIGHLTLGQDYPVRIQSMTDTPTADVEATLAQTRELIAAGSELVRWTVNDRDAAQGAAEAIRRLRADGITTPWRHMGVARLAAGKVAEQQPAVTNVS